MIQRLVTFMLLSKMTEGKTFKEVLLEMACLKLMMLITSGLCTLLDYISSHPCITGTKESHIAGHCNLSRSDVHHSRP